MVSGEAARLRENAKEHEEALKNFWITFIKMPQFLWKENISDINIFLKLAKCLKNINYHV